MVLSYSVSCLLVASILSLCTLGISAASTKPTSTTVTLKRNGVDNQIIDIKKDDEFTVATKTDVSSELEPIPSDVTYIEVTQQALGESSEVKIILEKKENAFKVIDISSSKDAVKLGASTHKGKKNYFTYLKIQNENKEVLPIQYFGLYLYGVTNERIHITFIIPTRERHPMSGHAGSSNEMTQFPN